MTTDGTLRVLYVEDDPDAALLFVRRLEAGAGWFRIDHELDLNGALSSLEARRYDALLLDLSLPDGRTRSTLALAATFARHVPIVVLTGSDDDHLALVAARVGIQDYLVKGDGSSPTLARSLRAAIERHGWMQRAIAYDARTRLKCPRGKDEREL
jgi:DNA-binding response OmpR family regulator